MGELGREGALDVSGATTVSICFEYRLLASGVGIARPPDVGAEMVVAADRGPRGELLLLVDGVY